VQEVACSAQRARFELATPWTDETSSTLRWGGLTEAIDFYNFTVLLKTLALNREGRKT